MKRLLAILSLINVLAAIGLTIVYLTNDHPTMVIVLASGLALQGLFTAAVAGRAFGVRQRTAERLAVAGNGVALLLGAVGFVYGFVVNIDAIDPEYGPMTVALLIAAHGAAAISYLRPSGPPGRQALEEGLTSLG